MAAEKLCACIKSFQKYPSGEIFKRAAMRRGWVFLRPLPLVARFHHPLPQSTSFMLFLKLKNVKLKQRNDEIRQILN